MRLYYFFLSVYYFLKQIFIKKHYDVVFYAPSHLNRGDNHENLYFKGGKNDSLHILNLWFINDENKIYSIRQFNAEWANN